MPATAATEVPKPEPRTDKAGAAGDAEEGAKNYDFYDMLPKFEVVVPEKDREVASESRRQRPSTSNGPGVYVLQAGSYRQQAEADRIRAQLKMQGIDANVQRVAVDDDVWHRVRIGPHHRSDRAQSPARAAARGGFRRCAGDPGGRIVRCGAVPRAANPGRRGIADAAGRLRHATGRRTASRHCSAPRRAAPAAPPLPAAHASRASRSPRSAT